MKNDVFHVRQRLWSHTFAEGKLRSFALRNVRSAERETPQRAKRPFRNSIRAADTFL